jgi:hypothetical protein
MLESMSSRLLNEWMVYLSQEPFGDELLDTHLATITAILYNANRPKKEKARQVKDYKFWQTPQQTFDAQGFFDTLKTWALMSGASESSDNQP